jgi:hypothetical protein
MSDVPDGHVGQVSPDGKWVWDGERWQPALAAEPPMAATPVPTPTPAAASEPEPTPASETAPALSAAPKPELPATPEAVPTPAAGPTPTTAVAEVTLQSHRAEVSPDGKWVWDGERWQPAPVSGLSASPAPAPVQPQVPVQAPGAAPKLLPNRLGGALVFVGAGMAVAGCLLPWISTSAPLAGATTPDAISGFHGEVIAGVAAVGALIGLEVWVHRVSFVVPLALLIALGLSMWIAVVDYRDMSGLVLSDLNASVLSNIGVGAYVTGLGGLLWAIGALLSFRRRRAR